MRAYSATTPRVLKLIEQMLTAGYMEQGHLNPVIRGWGEYYKRAHVRRLFNQLDRWVVRRLWSHHHRRWRCAGWKKYPARRLRGELGLVSLDSLIPSLCPRPKVEPS